MTTKSPIATAPAYSASAEWHAFIEPLLPVGERLVGIMHEPDDAQLRFELYRFISANLSAYHIALLHVNPDYPEFWSSHNEIFNFGYPNPDDVLYTAPAVGHGVYKLSGYRGTVRMLDLSVSAGPLVPRGTGELGPTFANYNFDDLNIDERGYFEVIVSAERPHNCTGDWWYMNPGVTYLLIRQRMYNLLSEVDGRIAIERLDLPAIKPRQTAAEIDHLLKQLPLAAEGWITYVTNWVDQLRTQDLQNKVEVKPLTQFGGVSSQHYIQGFFDIQEDEALVLETEVPATSRYWNFQLSDFLWRSVGWMHSQSSLNGHTAQLDQDGRFRAVISIRDPGVPNWLDTTGLKKGLIYGRWTGCSSQPVPTITKVKLADLRSVLPAATPTVSPEERDAAIRLHRRGVQLRRKW